VLVSREMGFHAAHSHKGMLSEPSHEHDFQVVLWMEGEVNEEGFVCDFRAVKRIFNNVVKRDLEGKNLDDLFDFPTAENIAVWVWEKMSPFVPLNSIEVKEKPHSRAVYYGPEAEFFEDMEQDEATA